MTSSLPVRSTFCSATDAASEAKAGRRACTAVLWPFIRETALAAYARRRGSPLDKPPIPIIVLVDDDSALLEALTLSLETEGFHVLPYASAELLLSEPNLPLIGCLVLDQKLPGMDGLALLARLRSRGVDLPATLITTPDAAVKRKAGAAGVSIVEKPLQSQGLVEKVRELLAERDAAPRC